MIIVFVGVLMILFCEGVEVLFIVVGMIVFLCKVGCIDVLWYVYVGWVVVLFVGGLIWVVVIYVVDISGVSWEVIEGLFFLFVVVVLLSVGFWMY